MAERDPPAIDFRVVTPTKSSYPYVDKFRTGDHFALVFPIYSGSVQVDERASTAYAGDVRPGTMRVQRPNQCSLITHLTSFRTLVVTVRSETFAAMVAGLDRSVERLMALKPLQHAHPEVNALVQMILKANQFHAAQRQLFLKGIVHSLLAVHFEDQEQALEAPATCDDDGLTDAQFARCMDYAGTRFEDGIDLDTWAAVIGMPTSEFSRRFHRTAGASPYAWFLAKRIERAQELLLTETTPIASLAIELGFSSQSHFTRAFSQRVGLSPARWRASQNVAGS